MPDDQSGSASRSLPHACAPRCANWAANAIVYHLVTDRFCRLEPGRPMAHGRAADAGAAGGFFGGGFAGVTHKIEQGWFTALGVNALWISAPYEQIHGWVPGGGGRGRHYAFHGYWPLDFTAVEPAFGTAEELGAMIDAAHAAGIRVLFDIAMSHPGYPDLRTLANLLPGAVKDGWEDASREAYQDYYNHAGPALGQWWGRDWIRSSLPGHDHPGDDALTGQLHGLPRFRTADDAFVQPPAFLLGRPGSQVVPLADTPVRGYLIAWLAEWVRRYGVDGFRCDSARHVELSTWRALKHAAGAALVEWKQANPAKVLDDAPFWMTGEVFDHGIERCDYFDYGFDSLINFRFQPQLQTVLGALAQGHHYAGALALHRLERLYAEYSAVLGPGAGHAVLSYVSSHDLGRFPPPLAYLAATALMLLPGGVQILYGDESGIAADRPHRAPDPGPDPDACPPMNWDGLDQDLLAHWRRLGAFRARHPAIARGAHRLHGETPYAFSRVDRASDDRVLVVLDAGDDCWIEVGDLFSDGTMLRDAYGGQTLTVCGGRVRVTGATLARPLLLEPTGPAAPGQAAP